MLDIPDHAHVATYCQTCLQHSMMIYPTILASVTIEGLVLTQVSE